MRRIYHHARLELVSQDVSLAKLSIDKGTALALRNAISLLKDGYKRAGKELTDTDIVTLLTASTLEEYCNVCDRNNLRR